MSTENTFLVGETEGKVFIKFVGNSTMKNSKSLADLFDNIFKGDKKEVILDLRECLYMDSTVLGLIAKVALKLRKTWQAPVYAMNVPNAIRVGLKSTGIDKLMEIIDNAGVKFVELTRVDTTDFKDKEAKTIHILEAHKTLMELSDENKKSFKNVVDLLENELKK